MQRFLILQERGGSKPGGNWLHGLPFLFINKAEEVLFGASALIFPKDAVLTAETDDELK